MHRPILGCFGELRIGIEIGGVGVVHDGVMVVLFFDVVVFHIRGGLPPLVVGASSFAS